MTLYSYVVRWDHGFAPNPFFGVCTLATCKPAIRKKAQKGDWVLGTGSAERDFDGRAIFLMRVDDDLSFNDFWCDSELKRKRPVMNGSLKQRFGDNIYHRPPGGEWQQADSRHSHVGGANKKNLVGDTSVDRVLLGRQFVYWGDQAPKLPDQFRKFTISRPGWKDNFAPAEVAELLKWAETLGDEGQVGLPVEWAYERWWRE